MRDCRNKLPHKTLTSESKCEFKKGDIGHAQSVSYSQYSALAHTK